MLNLSPKVDGKKLRETDKNCEKSVACIYLKCDSNTGMVTHVLETIG
jgi:hypothetical protein